MSYVRVSYVAVLMCACWFFAEAQSVSFDESDADSLVIEHSGYYEIVLSKKNGAMLAVIDKQTHTTMFTALPEASLWEAHYESGASVKSSTYTVAGPEAFSYAWDNTASQLTLSYGGSRIDAAVTIDASAHAYIDMRISLTNKASDNMSQVRFPVDWGFSRSAVNQALFPDKPGLLLPSSYFVSALPITPLTMIHPPLLADYLGMDIGASACALYSVWSPGPIRLTSLGFVHHGGDTGRIVHDFVVHRPNGYTWTSPPVRVRFVDDFPSSIIAYRRDNSIDDFASLHTKLGTTYDSVVQAPMFSFDGNWFDNYTDWPALFDRLPRRTILYMTNFWENGFHGEFPDIVPPNSEFGTADEFKAALDHAHTQGHLLMPMILPSWWHEESPTITDLSSHGVALSDIAKLDKAGNPAHACLTLGYEEDCGYEISPRAPYVVSRHDALLDSLTENYGFDMVYEDGLGAYGYGPDYNASAPDTIDTEAWIDHTRTYKDIGLMTESGHDYLAETEVGFLGGGSTPTWQEPPQYQGGRSYPMSAFLLKDKVLRYHYWGDPTISKEQLGWNMAFGYMLNIRVNPSVEQERIGGPWHYAVKAFQQHVVATYADELMESYSESNGGSVITCTYQSITITANKDSTQPYVLGDDVLPGHGVAAERHDGSLKAGVYTQFNGVALSDDDHYLIVETQNDTVWVYQPIGASTHLAVSTPSGWSDEDSVWIEAYDYQDEVIEVERADSMANGLVFFDWQRLVQGQSVWKYKMYARPQRPQADWQVFFNDVEQEYLRLGNRSYYEIGLSKFNGSLQYILDKTSGDTLTYGSKDGCLWRLEFPTAPGDDMVADPMSGIDDVFFGPQSMEYTWAADSNRLTLHYVKSPNATRWVEASISITLSDTTWFDMRMDVSNAWGYTAESIYFPYHMELAMSADARAILPAGFPGIVLEPGFFDGTREVDLFYPSQAFADFMSLRTGDGTMSVYTLHDTTRLLRMNRLGFGPVNDPGRQVNAFFKHTYPVWLQNDSTWSSPTLRFRTSEDVISALAHCRGDNNGSFASIRQKQGIHADRFLRSPLLQCDFGTTVNYSFEEMIPWLSSLPSPSIVGISGFGPADGNFPDILPPDARWGTTTQLEDMIRSADSAGYYVMPSLVPVWWSDNAPSSDALPSPEEAAVIGPEGSPRYEAYNGSGQGYYMSPFHSDTRDGLSGVMADAASSVSAYLLYERGILHAMTDIDLNPSAPDAMSNAHGWVAHVNGVRSPRLLVQRGCDRMCASAVGFVRDDYQPFYDDNEYTVQFGEGNWRAFPVIPMLIGDKAQIYNMNKPGETGPDALSWSMAFGASQGLIVSDTASPGSGQEKWLPIAHDFQRYVFSRIADTLMTGFSYTNGGVMQSTFGDVVVTRNMDPSQSYACGKHHIAPLGAMASSASGDLTAGVFNGFNGHSLGMEAHYLVKAKTSDSTIVVCHPGGNYTQLTINRPAPWTNDSTLAVYAVGEKGRTPVSAELTDSTITFGIERTHPLDSIAFYLVHYDIDPVGIVQPRIDNIRFALYHNYPNPFRGRTAIRYHVPDEAEVHLCVYDLRGRMVRTLVHTRQRSGRYIVMWNGRDRFGRTVAAGSYVYRIRVGSYKCTRKMTIH